VRNSSRALPRTRSRARRAVRTPQRRRSDRCDDYAGDEPEPLLRGALSRPSRCRSRCPASIPEVRSLSQQLNAVSRRPIHGQHTSTSKPHGSDSPSLATFCPVLRSLFLLTGASMHCYLSIVLTIKDPSRVIRISIKHRERETTRWTNPATYSNLERGAPFGLASARKDEHPSICLSLPKKRAQMDFFVLRLTRHLIFYALNLVFDSYRGICYRRTS
jgi:hypothetical protein